MKVLVGVHDGGRSGISTYAIEVAIAAARSGQQVTFLAAEREAAREQRDALEALGIEVVGLGLQPLSGTAELAARTWPGLAMRRLANGLRAAPLARGGFDVAHLNHPALAPSARRFARRVSAGAWFHPHALGGRLVETWRHTGGPGPRRAALAAKSISHHLNDRRGYPACDRVLAPTEQLAADLRRRGIAAVRCPPPVSAAARPASPGGGGGNGTGRLVVCAADLDHPRKNVGAAIRAAALLAAHRPLELELIGGGGAFERDLARAPRSLRVTRTGRLSATQVRERFRAADVLVLPSLFEEWGYVAVEALLAGTQVASLPVYPFAEMLSRPLGARAETMTDLGLAEAIDTALQESHERELISCVADQRFGAEAVGERMCGIWAEL
ncbi:MAG: glycosyltransferase [Candidatus Dormibacteraeota bacterium]|nr:glycosyltransferase [Candidatus Dormibacteraeota bacterium]